MSAPNLINIDLDSDNQLHSLKKESRLYTVMLSDTKWYGIIQGFWSRFKFATLLSAAYSQRIASKWIEHWKV